MGYNRFSLFYKSWEGFLLGQMFSDFTDIKYYRLNGFFLVLPDLIELMNFLVFTVFRDLPWFDYIRPGFSLFCGALVKSSEFNFRLSKEVERVREKNIDQMKES